MTETIVKEEELTVEKIKEKRKKGEIFLLTYDVIFKSVFIRNQNILIKMIKDIFDIEEENSPITIAGLETLSPHKDGKVYRCDLLVSFSDYSHVHIEMNNQKEDNVIDRNMVNLTRIESQILEKGDNDQILKDFRFRGLNFNNFEDGSGKPISYYAICELDSGRVASQIYIFCNINLDKCQKLVYNEDVRKLPKAVRWAAIMTQTKINNIANILKEDMITMEEKERFLNTIKEVNDNDTLLTDWIVESNAKLKLNSQLNYAKQEGEEIGLVKGEEKNRLEVIRNMLKKNTDYEYISDVTGKSIYEIKKIENDLNNNLVTSM